MELLEQFKLMQTTMQKTMKKNKKMGKGGMCAVLLTPPAPASRVALMRCLSRAAQGLAQYGRGDGGPNDAQDESADASALGRPGRPRANDVRDGEGGEEA